MNFLKAIFYKEWIKSREMVLLILTVALLGVAYTFIDTAYLFRSKESISIWLAVLDRKVTITSPYLEYFFLLTPLLISALQYSSEMVNKRFKLTLHLPLGESKIIAYMLAYGIGVVLTIQLVTICSLVALLSFYYPVEFIYAAMMHLVPFVLAGIAGYLFVAWVVLEPIWRRRVINTLYSIVALTVFTLGHTGTDYIYGLPLLGAMVGLAVVCSYLSASRFKDGAQN